MQAAMDMHYLPSLTSIVLKTRVLVLTLAPKQELARHTHFGGVTIASFLDQYRFFSMDMGTRSVQLSNVMTIAQNNSLQKIKSVINRMVLIVKVVFSRQLHYTAFTSAMRRPM